MSMRGRLPRQDRIKGHPMSIDAMVKLDEDFVQLDHVDGSSP